MITIQEAFDAIGRSVRSDASVIQAAVRVGFLVVHVDACALCLDETNQEYREGGGGDGYCYRAKEIEELGK